MMTKKLTVEQVTFDEPSTWPEETRKAIGELIVACSQWEYVVELIWKDLNPSQKDFVLRMVDADKNAKFGGKNVLAALQKEGSTESIKMEGLIQKLGSRPINAGGFRGFP